EVRFQLEEGELLVEPLPDRDRRAGLLFYEAAEGGAGVLTRVVHEQNMLADVAREALRLMHLDVPDDNDVPLPDARRLEDVDGACVRGCYRCLFSYYNQPDHEITDRSDAAAREVLFRLTRSRTTVDQQSTQPPASGGLPVVVDGWTGRWLVAAGSLTT